MQKQWRFSFNQPTSWTVRRSLPFLVSSLTLLIVLIGMFLFTMAPTQKAAAADPAITISKNIQYQEIEGFGTFGNKYPDYFGHGDDQRWPDDFLNLLVGDLGASINRQAMEASFMPARGEYHPEVLSRQVNYTNALQAKAQQLGEQPVRIIMSLWSPPAWMKQNGSLSGTDSNFNRLKDDDQTRQDLADFIVNYLKSFKQQTGVDVYAVSMQNEPELALSYASCYYTAEDLAQLLAVVGPRMQQEGLTTKLIYPEDVSNLGALSSYLSEAQEDPIARQHLKQFSMHGYSGGGVNPVETNKEFWSSVYDMTAAYNLPSWMTEVSGYDPTQWSAAMTLGIDVLSSLKYGQLSAWVWWNNSNWDSPSEGLFSNDVQPTMRSAVLKQFYRYVRPGAVMVDAASNDPDVLSVAFNHSQNHTLSVVLVNNSSSSKTMALNFAGSNIPDQFTVYRTSASELAVNAGTVTRSVTLPASSVTTLYGTFSGNDSPQAPTVVAQPQNQTVNAGSQVTLRAQVSGTPHLTYQWYRNGSAIDGAIGPLYTFVPGANDNGAAFTIKATNAHGTVTSSAATITLGSFTGASMIHTASAPVIDGAGNDSVWQNASVYPITHVTTNGDLSPQNISAKFQAAWDNTHLYFLVDVDDTHYATGSDRIEIYLDGGNEKNAYYDDNDWQFVYIQNTYASEVYKGGVRINPPAWPLYSQSGDGGGYSQEIAVPWAALGLTPSEGQFVGLEVHVEQQVTPGTANGKLIWHGTTNDAWHDPGRFGTGVLASGNGGGTPTPTPTVAVTPTATVTATPTATPPPTGNLPSPWQTADIGSVGVAGSATYDNGTFSVNGSGSDIGGTGDTFRYVYRQLNGNGSITARLTHIDYSNGYARAGLMIRESLEPGSKMLSLAKTACCESVVQTRSTMGGETGWITSSGMTTPLWLKLSRTGNTITASVSSDGSNWTVVSTQTVDMASTVYIGLAVVSHNNSVLNTSTFDNVSV